MQILKLRQYMIGRKTHQLKHVSPRVLHLILANSNYNRFHNIDITQIHLQTFRSNGFNQIDWMRAINVPRPHTIQSANHYDAVKAAICKSVFAKTL